MVTDQQVRRLRDMIEEGERLYKAADRSGMDEKTARKYLRLGKLPSECRSSHSWRTRTDVYKDVWPEVEEILQRDARIQAKAIFEHLSRKFEGQFQEGQLRTLQRQIKVWKAQHGTPKEVMFEQIHEPGKQSQSDFTHMGSLGVTIEGSPFDHLFFHFILPYSNWETGQVCFSEGFESFLKGFQDAAWELGGVCEEHRTDNFSAAVNNLSDKDEWTANYEAVLSHYGLKGSHNYPGNAHENGDVEQSHYRFKKAVEQELIIMGRRDFASREDYESFLRKILDRRNAGRGLKFLEERDHLRRLPQHRLEDYRRQNVRVTCSSTIRVRGNVYSVDSRLMGERVDVHIHPEHLEIWYAGKLMEKVERLRGKEAHRINYRHVVDSLVRKPGAFERYRYKSDLFPRLLFRMAYDELKTNFPARASRQYVKILWMAAYHGEERVHSILRHLIEGGEPIHSNRVGELLKEEGLNKTEYEVQIEPVNLAIYDELCQGTGMLV